MTGRFAPALTPTEWLLLDRSESIPLGPQPTNGGDCDSLIVSKEGLLAMDQYGYAVPAPRHKVASVALHGQPFGFTTDDVKLLRSLAQSEAGQYGPLIAEAIELDELASRIEALLPSKE